MKQIDFKAKKAQAKKMTTEQLEWAINDCKEAIDCFPEGEKAGYYQDEIHVFAAELQKRRKQEKNKVKLEDVLFVNNTGKDLKMFHSLFVEYIRTNKVHTDISDLFVLKKTGINKAGKFVVTIDWA